MGSDYKKKLSIIVGVIYRHPTTLKKRSKKFQRNSRNDIDENMYGKHKSYILGDINIDLKKHTHEFVSYCKILKDQSFKLLIPTTTRTSDWGEGGTLIDHIYTNDENRINAGTININRELTDHHLIHCCIGF